MQPETLGTSWSKSKDQFDTHQDPPRRNSCDLRDTPRALQPCPSAGRAEGPAPRPQRSEDDVRRAKGRPRERPADAGQIGVAGPAGPVVLGSTRNKEARTPDLLLSGQKRRRERWIARSVLWAASTRKSVRMCGRVLRPDVQDVPVRFARGAASYGQLVTCGNCWACPRCSGVLAATRSAEISRGLQAHFDAGGSAALLTLTTKHHGRQPLSDLWGEGVSGAWKAVQNSKAYRGGADMIGERDRYTIAGIVRVVEVMWSDPQKTDKNGKTGAGWHVHVHALVLTMKELTPAALDAFRTSVFGRWSAALVRQGLAAPLLDSGGADIRPVTSASDVKLADYFQKATYSNTDAVGLEIGAGALTKTGRNGLSVTPFQILQELVTDTETQKFGFKTPRRWKAVVPDKGSTARTFTYRDTWGTAHTVTPNGVQWRWGIWMEYEQASHGKRQLVWSKRIQNPSTSREIRWNLILDARGETAELTDEEAAATEDLEAQELVEVLRKSWYTVMIWRPALIYGLLEAAELAALGQEDPDDAHHLATGGAQEYAHAHGISLVT